MFNGKDILITGGAGSLGERCTQTLLDRYRPNKIILFSEDKLTQFGMQQHSDTSCLRFFIGDVQNYGRFCQAIGEISVPAPLGFEYHSGTNPDFLSVDELTELARDE